jgi:myosin heavy subunit
MSTPDDLTKLANLDPAGIEAALKARYEQDKIYTNINTLLVALNPYKQIKGIYSEATLKSYMQYAALPPQPHVYSIAADTYRGLLEAHSQSVIISGESGAGECAARTAVRPEPLAIVPRPPAARSGPCVR